MVTNNNPFIFLGDIHGSWGRIKQYIIENDIEYANFIQVGDFGVGYEKVSYEKEVFQNLSDFLKEKSCFLYVIRGNHDNPAYFDGTYNFERIFFLRDYTVLSNEKHNILCIGGATSIDRLHSQEQSKKINRPLWWADEVFVYNEGRLLTSIEDKKIDIVVTHNSPNNFYPYKFSGLVYHYAADDYTLLDDLVQERKEIRKVYEKLFDIGLPNYWFYGHFHDSITETHDDKVMAKLLNINEFYYLRDF